MTAEEFVNEVQNSNQYYKEFEKEYKKRKIKEEMDISYLFICHDIALVQNFCDRVLVMYQGRIVEEGIPDEVILHPKEEYTKNLIDSVL